MLGRIHAPLRATFLRAEQESSRLSFSQACALAAVALILLGSGLDYNAYPSQLWPFFLARALASLLIILIYFILPTPWGRRYLPSLTLLWLCIPQAMLAWMIAVTEGANSLYATSLHLTLIISGSILPFSPLQTLNFCMLTGIAYLLACLFHDAYDLTQPLFLFNAQLLSLTSTLCIFCTYLNQSCRFHLFRLSRKVTAKKNQLTDVHRNLTEIKSQFVQQDKLAAIGMLSAGLLHEINNPVNFCLMAITTTQKDPAVQGSPILQECLADIQQGMQRIQNIVSSMRTFAYRTPENQKASASFQMEKVIDSALHLTGHELHGVDIERDLTPDTWVRGDEAAIIGVLINLLSNAALALRTAQRAHPRIVISVQWQGDRLFVAITDNGPGIAEQDLARIFEPFFTTREIGHGLGLGMSISHSIIARHGGTLAVASQPGEWTRFTFDLPRANPEPAP